MSLLPHYSYICPPFSESLVKSHIPLSLEDNILPRERLTVSRVGLHPVAAARKSAVRAQSPKMKNKAAETKTHLDAVSATCSCPFPGSGGQGSLLEDGENSREMPVGETGSLCFATCSEGQASGEKKSESIWSRSCRKLKTVPAASLHLRPDTCEVPGALGGGGGFCRLDQPGEGCAWGGGIGVQPQGPWEGTGNIPSVCFPTYFYFPRTCPASLHLGG